MSSFLRAPRCLSSAKTSLKRYQSYRNPARIVGASDQISWFSSVATNKDKTFDKILVANRGEIACRIIQTCRRMGVETVAVYSQADGPNALHASMADEAIPIGTGSSPAESYLLGNNVIKIAQETGAQAIHPGYGFLSENADFCRAVQAGSLKFVGPPADAILHMGSKAHSKAIMDEAGVPTTPGYHSTQLTKDDPTYHEQLLHQAVHHVGFPLLIKASLGGGGKGMRLVHREADFLEALASCQRESLKAFGDDSVILEKYLQRPRHVEVQIMADTHGNVVHLYERDCSLQRRHQKVIEEAPASDLSMEMRQLMGDMGKRAAQAVGYVNAGTVEFLVDMSGEPSSNVMVPFYFCEMNTRLQVEHPVTEMITGLDLVEWQLRVAAGQELPIKDQNLIPGPIGHSMEARVYAENPMRDFLPSTGMVRHYRPPTSISSLSENGDIRVDTGTGENHEIKVHYDPMISKLIVHGDTREEARQKLVKSLQQYQIAGVTTNIPFLVECAQCPTFQQAGAVDTGFLGKYIDEIMASMTQASTSPLAKAIGAFVTLAHIENRKTDPSFASSTKASPWGPSQGSWRLGGDMNRVKRTLVEHTDGNSVLECWSNRDGSFEIRVPTEVEQEAALVYNIQGEWKDRDEDLVYMVVNGNKRMEITAAIHETKDGVLHVNAWSERAKGVPYAWECSFRHFLKFSESSASTRGGGGKDSGVVMAPMPGKIIRVNVSNGQSVNEGDILFVLEAMKMEHAITAPKKGVVTDAVEDSGIIVEDGVVLALVEEHKTEEVEGAA